MALSCLLYIATLNSCSVYADKCLTRKPPNTLPLLGNGILFLQARHKLFSWFVKCEQQFGFGTFQISVPSLPPAVVINDPRNLEFVFKNEAIIQKGEFFKRRSWDLFGMITERFRSVIFSDQMQEMASSMSMEMPGRFSGRLGYNS